MITCKCIRKFRDKRGSIYGYRLEDLNGNIQDVDPDNLKCAIAKGHVTVTNLKLTSNNKLIGANNTQGKYNSYVELTSEKPISNILGNTPNKPSYSAMNNNDKQAYLENRAKEVIDKTHISKLLDEYYGLYTYTNTMKASITTRYNYYDIEIILDFRKKTVEIIVNEENLDADEDDCLDFEELGRITCNDMHICSINKACDIIEDGVYTFGWSVDITNGKTV